MPVDLHKSDMVIGGVNIGKMYNEDNTGMYVRSTGAGCLLILTRTRARRYFLPSLIDEEEPADEKLFNPKCDPNNKEWQMTLSQSFVIKNFCPVGMMHRIISYVLRDMNAKPSYMLKQPGGEVSMIIELRQVMCHYTKKFFVFDVKNEATGDYYSTVEVFVCLYD